jgi:hypothetical protein
LNEATGEEQVITVAAADTRGCSNDPHYGCKNELGTFSKLASKCRYKWPRLQYQLQVL